MEILMRILVIIFEILYYSLFMKFSRKEGKFWKYILLFTFIQVFFFFVTSNFFISYMLLILMILFGIKYFNKTEDGLDLKENVDLEWFYNKRDIQIKIKHYLEEVGE